MCPYYGCGFEPMYVRQEQAVVCSSKPVEQRRALIRSRPFIVDRQFVRGFQGPRFRRFRPSPNRSPERVRPLASCSCYEHIEPKTKSVHGCTTDAPCMTMHDHGATWHDPWFDHGMIHHSAGASRCIIHGSPWMHHAWPCMTVA